MVAIIDYGVGNLFSLKSSLDSIGADSCVTSAPDIIKNADRIILPGVGAFEDAAKKLRNSGMAELLCELAADCKPIMGICLGMQLLFEKSFEYGEHKGLGLLSGEIVPICDYVPTELKIPHMGWNYLKFNGKNKLFKYVNEGDFVYFVHSYFAKNCGDSLIAYTDYGTKITAAVAKGNIFGCQFHPEKSGNVGLNILRAFCEEGEIC